MPGRRPRKVDCAGGSTAGNVAVVVVSPFGHGDGEEQTMGDPGVGGASALATPRSCFGSLAWGLGRLSFGCGVRMLPGENSAPRRQRRRCLRVSLPSWGRRCGYPPRGLAPGENLRPRGLVGGGALRRYPLGGVVVESGLDLVSCICLQWQV
jgi:hypothetical protein